MPFALDTRLISVTFSLVLAADLSGALKAGELAARTMLRALEQSLTRLLGFLRENIASRYPLVPHLHYAKLV